jgi:hypothetical protein
VALTPDWPTKLRIHFHFQQQPGVFDGGSGGHLWQGAQQRKLRFLDIVHHFFARARTCRHWFPPRSFSLTGLRATQFQLNRRDRS